MGPAADPWPRARRADPAPADEPSANDDPAVERRSVVGMRVGRRGRGTSSTLGGGYPPAMPPPRIVVTVAVPGRHRDPDLARRRNERYAEALRRHGAEPLLLDAASDPAERAAAFASMAGLVLSGGGDIDPARYGRPNLASADVNRDRDELEAQAWRAAEERA